MIAIVLSMASCYLTSDIAEDTSNEILSYETNDNRPIDEYEENTVENQQNYIRPFSLDDYKSELEKCGSDKNIGPIENIDVLKEKAISLFKEEFGEDVFEEGHFDKNSFAVGYDDTNDCWYINCWYEESYAKLIVETPFLSAAPCALIKKDGTVLAIWY